MEEQSNVCINVLSNPLNVTPYKVTPCIVTQLQIQHPLSNVNELHFVSLCTLSQIGYWPTTLLWSLNVTRVVKRCGWLGILILQAECRLAAMKFDHPAAQWTVVLLSVSWTECLACAKLSEFVALCVLNPPATVAQSSITNYFSAAQWLIQ